MTTATLVRTMEGMRGDARIYRLEPPYKYTRWGEEEEREAEFVAVSAVDLPTLGLPGYRTSETMIFPSDGEDVTDFGELVMIPHKDHDEALAKLGYVVATPSNSEMGS